MNDVVFADSVSAYEKAAPKFDKCLKIFVPQSGGERRRLCAAGGEYVCGAGEYAVLPPHFSFKTAGAGEEDVVVCIEQPLISGDLQARVIADTQTRGMYHAVLEAALRLRRNVRGAALSALGQLIVAYAAESFYMPLHPAIIKLKADLEKNFADGAFSADGAIGKLPLNGDYVRKLFKKQVGITPHDYLNGLRMKRAEELILSGISNGYSRYTVAQIAEACGFAEPLYFSRVFKKFYGVSPMRFADENK